MPKRCYNCNQKIEDSTLVCPNCGKNVYDENGNLNRPKVLYELGDKQSTFTSGDSNLQTNKFALAGFILSIISVFTNGLFLWLGLIFSIIGLIDCKQRNQKGKTYAIIGIVISAIYIILGIIFAALLYFAFSK